MALSAVTLTSCSDEALWSDPSGEGVVRLNLTSDGRVMRQTRADDSQSPVVPDVNLFGINLAKADGTYSKSWNTLEAFNREKSFPIGDYTISASYGDINREGFDNPFYSGKADAHVAPGAESTVNVVATLANSMVSIRYKEEFTRLYSAYSAAVQTEGHDWVIFAQNEDRPAYVAPGDEVKLKLTLTDEAGGRVEIQPASFKAEPRHHYVVTIGVNGSTSSGDLALDIEFDEDVVAETVTVPLGDELFTAPAPTVTAKGFTPETPIGSFEYAELKTDPEFHIFAFGGFKEATLTVVSENGYTPAFGGSVNLIGADNLISRQLESEGVGSYFRNADKMGLVNVKKFLEKLPAGKYTIMVDATDVMTRIAEPVRLTAEITPLEIELAPVANAEFMGSEVAVDLSTNCPDIKNVVGFKVPDANNRMVDAEIKSVSEVTASGAAVRAGLGHTFRYLLALVPSFRSEVDVEMSLKANSKKTAQTKVSVNAPEYKITPDAFSNRVVLKIESDRPEIVKTLVDNMLFFNGSIQVPTANITHDSANGIVTVSGLTPAVQYVALKAACGSFEKTVPEFTTEAEIDVPNGSFNNTTETIRMEDIPTGGQYSIAWGGTHQNKSSIVVREPDGWSSINAKTCYDGADPKNTWFVVPSTFMKDGKVVIRSVAYDFNGQLPEVDNRGAAGRGKYFSTKAPSTISHKSSGELFLGTYKYTSSGEERSEGVPFKSRPSCLYFDYTYVPNLNSSESGSVEIEIVLDNDATISKKILLGSSSEVRSQQIELSSYPFGHKATAIKIKFKSTDGTDISVTKPSGNDLDDINNARGADNTISENSYKALATGSVLTVDNVRLGYEVPATKAAKKIR